MAEREQSGIENVAPESSVPRQHDAPVSKVCSEFERQYVALLYNTAGKGYFAECGLRNAESCQRVICGKFDADFFLRNEG